MTHEVIFNSELYPDGEMIGLACGHISLNKIEFVNEHITVNIEAKTGEIEVINSEGEILLSVIKETPLSGDEKFSEVKCIVEGDYIKLGFPKYTYKDNYPNCDGEYDRWTKTISGFDFLCYDYKNNCIVE